MKRIVSVIAVAALMVVMMAAMAAPAFARSCVGATTSEDNVLGKKYTGVPGTGGAMTSQSAQFGQVPINAKTVCNF
jgi:hypothetical protein